MSVVLEDPEGQEATGLLQWVWKEGKMDGQGLGLRPPGWGKQGGGWVPWPPLIWSWDLEELSQWQVTDEVIVGLSGSSWPSAVGWKASAGCEGTALPLCPHGLLGGPTWAMFTGLEVARPPGPGEGGSVGHDAPPCALLENGQKPGQSESRGDHMDGSQNSLLDSRPGTLRVKGPARGHVMGASGEGRAQCSR